MKVLLFLAEGFEDLEAISILDVMGWTEYRESVPTIKVVTTGFRPVIRSRFGLRIQPDIPFDRIKPSDYAALAIPGGFHSHGFDEAYDERLRQLARDIHVQGGWIATFCVGVLPVAEAGLLKDKQATTYPYSRNHDNVGRLKELGARVVDEPVAVDDRIISCAGPASSLEVAWRLLGGLLGAAYSEEVKRLMCVDDRDSQVDENREMKYQIQQKEGELTIGIDGAASGNPKLLDAFQECREGRCDCPTDEYDKLEGIQVEQTKDHLSLRLKVKPGQSLDGNAVAACMDHTLKKSTKDN